MRFANPRSSTGSTSSDLMTKLDRRLLRELADWTTDGFPVTSLYLDVDGRRFPRRADYLVRLDDLLRKAGNGPWSTNHRRSIDGDAVRIRRFVSDEFDRDGTRGLALFSSTGPGLWKEVELPQSVRDRLSVAPRPQLLPLEAVLESFESFCTALVDGKKARVFMTVGGQIEEVSEILDDVPGRHDQGGWAQARLQRHIKDHIQRHLKHVADVLLQQQQEHGFDHLILAGPDEVVAELERELHDYVRRTVVGRVTLPMTARAIDVLERTLAIEEELQTKREWQAVDRLVSEIGSATGRAVAGFEDTIGALESGRVETLIVAFGLEASGVRCTRCGHLSTGGDRCTVCGGEFEEAPDLVEEAMELALRQRCEVETVQDVPGLSTVGGIGALLRF
jgi:peptide chain release factor subunit 1